MDLVGNQPPPISSESYFTDEVPIVQFPRELHSSNVGNFQNSQNSFEKVKKKKHVPDSNRNDSSKYTPPSVSIQVI